MVNLYPFAAAAANPATPFDALVEEIDIGGPSMVRAAAKNFRDVLVVVDPADYAGILTALDQTPSLEFRFDLARKAIAHTAAYDTAIAATLSTVALSGSTFVRGQALDELPSRMQLTFEKIRDLRYGENPHQRAAWYGDGPGTVASGFSRTTILQGKELWYTNLLDLDAAARIVLEFDEPAAAVVKHTNPCGAAIGDAPADAYVRARDADTIAAFGGIVALNRTVDVAAAEAIASTRIDALIAPGVDDAARAVLARKAGMRVVVADFSRLTGAGTELRSILGATLVQERDRVVEARAAWSAETMPDGFSVATRRQPTADEWQAHAICVASGRARQVEYRHLHRRAAHARGRRRPDEPRGRGERRGHESA